MNINEREASLNILEDIFTKKSYNNLALKDYLKKNTFEPIQKSFITEIVNGVLRNCIYLDYVIGSFIQARRMKPFIMNLLRVSAYQILFMDKTPDYAIINEAVNICRKRGFHELCGFVNAVLRKISAKGAEVTFPDKIVNPVGYLSTVYSIPEWIVKMWISEYGNETCALICEALNKRPQVTVCVNTNKVKPDELLGIFFKEGVAATKSSHVNALTVTNTSDLSELPSFKKGYFHVMDISAMMAVDMLNAAENDNILDVCAAPGGKAFYMSYKYKARITACDIFPHKLKLLKESAKRLKLDITVKQQDAGVNFDSFNGIFDSVLVDAPCSGLGLLRKKPDIRLNRNESDIESLSAVQIKILNNCASYVKEGGVLLYCTCTLSKRENKDIIKEFLSNNRFALDGEKEILPQDYGSDGFYIARLRKRNE